MSTVGALFHTATFEHRVPGEHAEMAAVSYNLQYTKGLVDEFVASNPPRETEQQTVRIGHRDLIRVNHYGSHPKQSGRRICTIGVGDRADRARAAATSAWFDFHASMLFADKVGPANTHRLAIRRPVPGAPAQRAMTVGVTYDLDFMRAVVDAAVGRNRPTYDEFFVVEAGELTLMRVNLYGTHPLESGRRICVGGIADRHYRAVAGAEQAWAGYHTTLLFAAQALGSL
jgi:hypothetical protein